MPADKHAFAHVNTNSNEGEHTDITSPFYIFSLLELELELKNTAVIARRQYKQKSSVGDSIHVYLRSVNRGSDCYNCIKLVQIMAPSNKIHLIG